MATNTTASFTNLTGNGTAGPFNVSFSYLSEAEVDVFVGGVLKTITTHYTFTSTDQITFTSGNEPANGAVIKFQRDTNIGAKKVDFNDGSVLTESDLDTQNDQLLFGLQELSDEYVKRDGSQTVTGNIVFEGSTDDNNETTLAITDPTADRTITLPDRSGTVITSGDTGTVTSTMIEDGTIVNADVNASAAIAGTKVTPAFGSQNLSTTGTAATGALSVTGNIGVSGTVDGRDVAADGTKLDGIEDDATQDQTSGEIKTLLQSDKLTVNEIADDAVTYAKMQNVSATDRVLGRDSSGAGDVEEITPANLRTMINVEDGATADQSNSEIKTAYEANSNTNAFTDAEKTKLTGISTGADVTSSNSINALTDVNTSGVADGKILKYQASSSSFIIADDTGGSQGATTFTGLTDTPANYGSAANKTLKVNSSGNAVEFVDVSTDIVNDTTPQLGGNLDVQANEINTSTTNGNIKLNPNGTGVVEIKGDGSSADGTLQLNCSHNSHGVKIKSPAHSAGAIYTLTLPTNIVNNQFLKTDTNGNLSWAAVDASSLEFPNGATGVSLSTQNEIKINDASHKIVFDTDTGNSHQISFAGPSTLTKTSAYTLPEDGSSGTFLKTNGSGALSFGVPEVINDTSPQLGGTLDVNSHSISFDTNIFQKLKTGATNAVVNGITQHVQQGSLIIDGGQKDIFFKSISNGGKITFGSADGATHEIMRITPSVLGASQHGKVELKYVTANVGGSTSSANRLETTSTGMTFTGVIVPAADSTHDLGTDAVRWRNLYADTLYGDGSNLTGVSGAKGGSGESIFYESENAMDSDYTISSNHNALVAGPLTINATLTINSPSVVTIP